MQFSTISSTSKRASWSQSPGEEHFASSPARNGLGLTGIEALALANHEVDWTFATGRNMLVGISEEMSWSSESTGTASAGESEADTFEGREK